MSRHGRDDRENASADHHRHDGGSDDPWRWDDRFVRGDDDERDGVYDRDPRSGHGAHEAGPDRDRPDTGSFSYGRTDGAGGYVFPARMRDESSGYDPADAAYGSVADGYPGEPADRGAVGGAGYADGRAPDPRATGHTAQAWSDTPDAPVPDGRYADPGWTRPSARPADDTGGTGGESYGAPRAWGDQDAAFDAGPDTGGYRHDRSGFDDLDYAHDDGPGGAHSDRPPTPGDDPASFDDRFDTGPFGSGPFESDAFVSGAPTDTPRGGRSDAYVAGHGDGGRAYADSGHGDSGHGDSGHADRGYADRGYDPAAHPTADHSDARHGDMTYRDAAYGHTAHGDTHGDTPHGSIGHGPASRDEQVRDEQVRDEPVHGGTLAGGPERGPRWPSDADRPGRAIPAAFVAGAAAGRAATRRAAGDDAHETEIIPAVTDDRVDHATRTRGAHDREPALGEGTGGVRYVDPADRSASLAGFSDDDDLTTALPGSTRDDDTGSWRSGRAAPVAVGTSPERREHDRQSRGRRNRGRVVGAAAVVFLLGVVAAGAYLGYDRYFAHRPAPDFDAGAAGPAAVIRIEPGDTASEVAAALADKGVVESADAFFGAAVQSPAMSQLMPGFYSVPTHVPASEAVAALADPTARVGQVVISEGRQLHDVRDVQTGAVRRGILTLISEASCLDGVDGAQQCVSVEDLDSAAATADPSSLGVPAWATEAVTSAPDPRRRLEGLIAAGSWDFDPSTDAHEILRSLISGSAARYEETGIETAASTVGLSPYEMLVAASLVEREAMPDDFAKVARVILNRLDVGQALEFDSTVNYALEETELATTDVDRGEVTPWNTYASPGLPATPISSPSIEALRAMENPEPGDWLYFVTIDAQGTTLFTHSYEEHLQNTQHALNNGILDSSRPEQGGP